MTGSLHPKAVLAALNGDDQGRVSPSLEMSNITLMLAPSSAQQAALDQLLAAQQTPDSPDYHRWLTPEEFGQRFGASDGDIAKISQWLEQQGLQVRSVGRGRNWIMAAGTAAQAEAAFQTEIHNYLVDGEVHFANASAPSIPAAFVPVVRGIRGLNNFRLKPRARPAAALPKEAGSHTITGHYTDASGTHFLAPADFATIYDVTPLYNTGSNGAGQKIAVAGQIEVDLTDIERFRARFGLPANDPKPVLVPGSASPGSSSKSGDLAESDLDLEWAGAIAPNATILFVYSTDVMTSVQYAIDQNLAPVLSLSYGSCELETPRSEHNELSAWAQQANAQGITWLAASGDNGAADCNDSENPGLAVDLPGSVPEVTSVGGTGFVEGSGHYWNATNSSGDASALSYIPEAVWNTSIEDQEPSSSGGGASVLFSKPSWQTGAGVPADNARDVPDISMSASNDHDPYLVYTSGSLQAYGGTSVPTPSFAGVIALLNQKLGSGGVGNINPKLYAIAHSSPSVFHDVTAGNNIVTAACSRRQITCSNVPVGYNAGVGYDLATGLGSVDAYKLITVWTGGSITTPPSTNPSANITLSSNLSTVGPNDIVYLTAIVTGVGGTTPSGSVAFAIGGTALGSATLTGSGGRATATLALNGLQLPSGSGTITATYNGSSAASVHVAVNTSGPGPSAAPAVSKATNGASFQQGFAPGAVLSLFGSGLSPLTQSASTTPLPLSISGVEVLVNGVAAPLYYVSPSQLNVQVPYETTVGGTALVSINNNGRVTTQNVPMAAAAPGIFTNSAGQLVPTASASLGKEIALYITGAGAVQPAVADGVAPASSTPIADLPVPGQRINVTVGGMGANIDFMGIPWGLVGVTQINVTVPAGLAAGAQPVIVNVGGVSSPPATLTVSN
ncbi:MAG TPA: protease pro-enzyme activation domain-containing protein [Bryobacteraceae bacterium]|nr:protease pro-enzyme activation domain-containing protein [Bryobacteraceae bacterium]